MKKKATLLIASIIFCLATSNNVLAFSDTADTAITELSKYKIINGYTDNTFKPLNNITRAEFATIITRLTFNESTEAPMNNVFTDVSDGWAKKYIYICKHLGIVNGKTASTFAPNDNVTYEQAIKMLVSSIGYEQEAVARGGYPDGYIKVANDLGILKGVDYEPKDNATRLSIAKMVYNAMGVDFYFIYNNSGEIEREKAPLTIGKYFLESLQIADAPSQNVPAVSEDFITEPDYETGDNMQHNNAPKEVG